MNKIFTLSVCTFLLSVFSSNAQTLPAGFSASNIASGWTQPTGALFTPDGQKLFVWEKRGHVYLCNRDGSGNYIKQATPVLNIAEEVGNWRDHGLLGFAIDPSFATNGYIYLLYVVDRHHLLYFGTGTYSSTTDTYTSATISRVTRYQTGMSGTNLVANPASRQILIGETKSTGIPLLYESHSIGALQFAADGTLLVSTGDGASYSTTDPGNISHTYYVQALADGIIRAEENVGSFRAQMLNSHDGKLLRINPVNGDGVVSNPFYDPVNPRSAKSRVWALGFRNPFRFIIKPGTGSANPLTGDIGEIYVGDVKWNTWEELTIINKAGANAGWPLFEGLTTISSYYNLSTPNRDEPNPLYNGAGCPGQFYTFKSLLKQETADQTKTVYNPCNPAQAIGTHNRHVHQRPAMDWRHGQDLARVGIFNGNNSTEATIGTPQSGVGGTPFRGNAAVAGCWYTGNLFPAAYRNTFLMADYGGQWIRSFTVNFTDKITNVQNFSPTYGAVVCVVQNPLDGTIVVVDIGNNTVKRISYGGNQQPIVKITADKNYGPSGLLVNFDGRDCLDPDGTLANYSWNFGDGFTSTLVNPTHNFNAPAGVPTRYIVKLTITDNQGATSMDSMIVSVNNTPPVVNITSPIKNSTYIPGTDTLYICAATVSDTEHGPASLKYAWQTALRHNNHSHAEPIDTNRNTSALISRIGCNGDTYYWHVTLSVTDAAGLTTIDSSQVFPDCLGQSLPVVLRTFSVAAQPSSEHLVKWTTEQEENIAYFELERSTTGNYFVPVNRQTGRNLRGLNEYSYSDKGFVSGVIYYRLKIVDKDGRIKYSIIIKTISDTRNTGFTISPNPGKGNFAVVFNSVDHEPVTILIRDVNGRLLQTINEKATRGQNVIYVTGFENKPSGFYLVTLNQGDNISQGKFIKAE